MNAKEVLLTVALLAIGALLNFGYPVVAQAYAVPVGVEAVIIAYCLVVMLVVPLRLAEVAGIGVLAGLLTILSTSTHIAAIIGGQVSWAVLSMALFNLVSEPVGITICFLAFTLLAVRVRQVAPLVAAFIATLASGGAYLVLIILFNPVLISAQPSYPEAFLYRVILAAIVNAVVVQIVFMLVERPVKAYLAGPED